MCFSSLLIPVIAITLTPCSWKKKKKRRTYLIISHKSLGLNAIILFHTSHHAIYLASIQTLTLKWGDIDFFTINKVGYMEKLWHTRRKNNGKVSPCDTMLKKQHEIRWKDNKIDDWWGDKVGDLKRLGSTYAHYTDACMCDYTHVRALIPAHIVTVSNPFSASVNDTCERCMSLMTHQCHM